MPLQPENPAPYTSAGAITGLLDRWRHSSLPATVNPDMLIRFGIKESIVPRTLTSLKLLELTDESGAPTETLDKLMKARPDDYKAEFGAYLRSVYASVFEVVEPADADASAIKNAFWGYEPRGQLEAIVRLFLGLCEYAGIIDEAQRPQVAGTPRPAVKSATSARPVTKAGREVAGVPKLRFEAATRTAELEGLPPGLVGLIRQIPVGGKVWTQATRDAFLTAFTAVLDFTVPIGDPVAGEIGPDS